MGKDEKKWASIIGLVGLLELQWKTPHYDWLVEFLNTYQIKWKVIYARMWKKTIVIDQHLIADVIKNFNKGWKKQKQADKQTAKAMLQCITLLGWYVNIEQWSVNKMKKPCDNRLLAFIQIIYQKDKVYFFSNRNAISIMTIVKGKEVDWANNLFK